MRLTTAPARLALVATMAIALASLAPAALADTSITIQALDSADAPLSGVRIDYKDGYWRHFGNTDGSGEATKAIPDGTYEFRAQYGGTMSDTQIGVVTAGAADPLLTFKTKAARVLVTDSTSAPLGGVRVDYHAGYWRFLGNTSSTPGPDEGVATGELFGDSIDFRARRGGTTSSTETGNLNVDPAWTFVTKEHRVGVIDSAGGALSGVRVDYKAGYWRFLGNTDGAGHASIELFGCSLEFRAKKGGTTASSQFGDACSVDAHANATTFQTLLHQVGVISSASAALPGVRVDYKAGYWRFLGNTDGAGQASIELFGCSLEFRAKKGGTTAASQFGDACSPDVDGNATVFQTMEAKAKVADCDDNGIEGARVDYHAGYWRFLGNTDASGFASIELFDGERKFRSSYKGTKSAEIIAAELSAAIDALFQTTRVTLVYSGPIKYHAGYWRTFTKPTMNLFPGTRDFKFGTDVKSLDIAGCTFQRTIVRLVLKDHLGNPLAGGTARGGAGASYSTWHVSGSTGADGVLLDARPGSFTTMSYEMKFNNTTEHQTQDVTVNDTFEFKTNLLTVRLETSDGVGLDGGSCRYGNGATYTSWWFPGGATGSSATGETAAEVFSGTYSFEMQYQATAERQISVAVPDADHVITFVTTSLTLQYTGSISYGGATGDSRFFSKPTMELLEGTYKFHFRSCDRVDLTIPDAPSFTESAACVELLSSTNAGLSGGDVDYRFGFGSYVPAGTTDGAGHLLVEIPGLVSTTKFRMSYLGGTTGDKSQDISADSFVIFQTVPVTARLRNSSDSGDIVAGVSFEYRYGFAGKMAFVGPLELLPLNTKMTVYYHGAAVEKQQNTGSDPNFVFNTVAVTAVLKASDGFTDLTADAFDLRYGFDAYQSFSSPTDLLPVNTKMRVSYKGATVEKQQSVSGSPDFVFDTVAVTATLENHDMTVDLTGSASFEFRYGFASYQAFAGPTDLLPVNTKMRVSYAGGVTSDVQQNVGSNAAFEWQTGAVHSDSATATTYRYGFGSNMAFVQDMELLPLSTKFKFSDLTPETTTVVAAGVVNHIH